MASRTILRWRRLFSDYIHTSGRSVHGLSHGMATTAYSDVLRDSRTSQKNSFDKMWSARYTGGADFTRRLGHGLSDGIVTKYSELRGMRCSESSSFDKSWNTRYICADFTRRGDITRVSALLLFRMQTYQSVTGHGGLGNMVPMGVSFVSQSSRFSSLATSPKPGMGNDEGDKEQSGTKRKGASPEECDQAVEGLTTAKAKIKAKAKQSTESQKPKPASSILKKTRAMLLGIGPALRVVASMSREDWAKKLVHWKIEFVDTMKHYWLGIKLLGVDVKISSRLLLKLAGGKSLSRRERQQLTRTTADIFRLVPVAVFIIVPQYVAFNLSG